MSTERTIPAASFYEDEVDDVLVSFAVSHCERESNIGSEFVSCVSECELLVSVSCGEGLMQVSHHTSCIRLWF